MSFLGAKVTSVEYVFVSCSVIGQVRPPAHAFESTPLSYHSDGSPLINAWILAVTASASKRGLKSKLKL